MVTDVEQRFYEMMMRRAYEFAATDSNDRSTKNAAILVSNLDPLPLAVGVNKFVPGYDDRDVGNHKRPWKYIITEHAERAAIYNAAARGVMVAGLTMVCPWACCPDCARAIVLSGIKRVVGHKQAADMTPPRWQGAVRDGLKILEGGGVEFIYLDAKLGGCNNLFDGETWTP